MTTANLHSHSTADLDMRDRFGARRSEIQAEVEKLFLPPNYGNRTCLGCGLTEQLTVKDDITYSNLSTWAQKCQPCLEAEPEPEVDEAEECAASDRYEHGRTIRTK